MAFLRLQTALLLETACFSLPVIFHIWIAMMISKQEDKRGLWLSHSFSNTFSFPRIYAFPSKNVRCNGGSPWAAQLNFFSWVLVGHNILLNQSMLYSSFISLPWLLKILLSTSGEIRVFSEVTLVVHCPVRVTDSLAAMRGHPGWDESVLWLLTGSSGLASASVNFKNLIQPLWLPFSNFLTNKIFIDFNLLKSHLKMYFLEEYFQPTRWCLLLFFCVLFSANSWLLL